MIDIPELKQPVIYRGKTYTFPGHVCGVTDDGQVIVRAIGTPEGHYAGMKHIFGPSQLEPWVETESPAADVASIAARYHRLHSICERILWTDLGAPAMGNPKTQAAMQELSELMLTDALIEASGRAALESKGGSDGRG